MPKNNAEELLSLATMYDADFNPASPPHVIERGEGAIIVDTTGHETIDMGDIVVNIGHCHPKQVAALRDALGQMMTGKSGLTSPPRANLVKRLVDITPDNLDKVYLVTGGGEAIDWAVRIARRATGKHEILAFWGGVYGRTYATMSLNGVGSRRRQFGPMMSGVIHAPYAYCYRCPFQKQFETCDFFCVDYLDQVMDHQSTDDLAAIIVEPYQGVGGMIFPPEGYLTRLQDWAAQRGVLFILDEIQSGFGRTGTMFALEWESLRPNMLAVGKGMGSGISIAALIAEHPLFDTVNPGELSGGNGGNYLACTSALSVIEIIDQESLLQHARKISTYFLEQFKKWQEEFVVIGDVRGQGLALAIEFVKDRETKEPYKELVQEIGRQSYLRGVSVGSQSHIMDIRPPLVISEEQAQKAAAVIEDVLRKALS